MSDQPTPLRPVCAMLSTSNASLDYVRVDAIVAVRARSAAVCDVLLEGGHTLQVAVQATTLIEALGWERVSIGLAPPAPAPSAPRGPTRGEARPIMSAAEVAAARAAADAVRGEHGRGT